MRRNKNPTICAPRCRGKPPSANGDNGGRLGETNVPRGTLGSAKWGNRGGGQSTGCSAPKSVRQQTVESVPEELRLRTSANDRPSANGGKGGLEPSTNGEIGASRRRLKIWAEPGRSTNGGIG